VNAGTNAGERIPPYDPELMSRVGEMPPAVIGDDQFQAWRALPLPTITDLQPSLDELGLTHEEHVVPVPDGRMTMSVIRRAGLSTGSAAMYNIHAGGMVLGNRFGTFIPDVLRWIVDHDLVVFSPEYTLAPEERAPRAAIECHAGLTWIVDNANELGVDPNRVILAGASGGGGLAASVSLLARDNEGPQILAQMLLCPQLDDRHETVSSRQFTAANGAVDPWPSETNRYAWNALLGEGHEHSEVSSYASPARARDLSNLPPAFIDVGGSEVFRDADVAYASRLWACGVPAELHVWPGGFHGFDVAVPNAGISLAAKAARDNWLRRTLTAAGKG
jgi:acetyl esterase/lipase